MCRLFNRLSGALLTTLLVLSPMAQGASQGALGQGNSASSSGSMQVGLVVPEMVKLTGINDVMLQWDAGKQAFAGSDDFCVFRNISGTYSVTATSTEGGSQFLMKGDAGSALPYEVQWNGEALNAGSRSSVRGDAHTTAVDCDGGSNITLSVSASAEQVSGASRTGLHTDTLVLEVIAE